MARLALLALVPIAVLASCAGMLIAVLRHETRVRPESRRAVFQAPEDEVQPSDPYPWGLLRGLTTA